MPHPVLWTYCFLVNAIILPFLFLEIRCKKLTVDINNLFWGFPNFFTQFCLSVTIYFLPSEFIFVCGFWNLNIEKFKYQLILEIIWFSESSGIHEHPQQPGLHLLKKHPKQSKTMLKWRQRSYLYTNVVY